MLIKIIEFFRNLCCDARTVAANTEVSLERNLGSHLGPRVRSRLEVRPEVNQDVSQGVIDEVSHEVSQEFVLEIIPEIALQIISECVLKVTPEVVSEVATAAHFTFEQLDINLSTLTNQTQNFQQSYHPHSTLVKNLSSRSQIEEICHENSSSIQFLRGQALNAEPMIIAEQTNTFANLAPLQHEKIRLLSNNEDLRYLAESYNSIIEERKKNNQKDPANYIRIENSYVVNSHPNSSAPSGFVEAFNRFCEQNPDITQRTNEINELQSNVR